MDCECPSPFEWNNDKKECQLSTKWIDPLSYLVWSMTFVSIVLWYGYKEMRFFLTTAALAGNSIYLVHMDHISYKSMYAITIATSCTAVMMLEKLTCKMEPAAGRATTPPAPPPAVTAVVAPPVPSNTI